MNTRSKRPLDRIRITLLAAVILSTVALGCRSLSGLSLPPTPTIISEPTPSPTPLPPIPVEPGENNPNEPVFIIGDIPFTSPFFLRTNYEPFVLLEDEAGFIQRNKEFTFRLDEQAIGPVEFQGEDKPLTYSLALPSIPQGTQSDLDNDGHDDPGVQVFAIAYWVNTWGGPFLEPRDGRGWSTSYVSTITDPEKDDEIVGGILVVWAPDDRQSFPSGFGADGKLFTQDDPAAPIPAGYNLVDLNKEPFRFYKEARPRINLNEGDIAVNDYSSKSYPEAFAALVEKVGREYPFTKEKGINWQALKVKYEPRVAAASDDQEFYKVIHEFIQEIPDGHVGIQINTQVFLEERGGGFGMILTELSDGRVLVTKVFPDSPANKAGIEIGAEILNWDSKPVSEALDAVSPYFGPYSTKQDKQLEQVLFLTRVPEGTTVDVTFRNPGDTKDQEASMKSVVELSSLFSALPESSKDQLVIPVEGQVLDDSGLGYIRVNTFLDDSSLTARLWEHFIKGLIDNKIPGLIIDLRANSGGNAQLPLDFAGYFFKEEFTLYETLYYNEITGIFEKTSSTEKIDPGPLYYDGPIAVLVSPYCFSACESFAYALSRQGRSTVVGHYPSAGAFGEVGRGQYKLPGDISMQFPTGRSETPDGKLLLEGTGVIPDIIVPVTEDSALGKVDAVLQAAIDVVLNK